MKGTFIIGALLVVVSACTVEKRRYNPGWNVQWRKHHHVSNSAREVEVNKRVAVGSKQNQSSDDEITFVEAQKENRETLAHDEVLEVDFVSSTPKFQQEPEDTTKKSIKTVSPYADMSTSRARRPASTGVSQPTTLLILGSICLLGAVILFFILPTITETIALSTAALGMVVLGIFGIVALIIGLMMFFVLR